MALADDMNLIARTPQGLHVLIHHSTTFLLQCGMKIKQTHTVSVVVLAKENKIVVVLGQTFTIDGLPIKALFRADGWTHLRISCDSEGRSTPNLKSNFLPLLERLTKALLEPQQ